MTGRDDDRTWAELVESFHASPDAAPTDESRRWPAAEDVSDEPSITLDQSTMDEAKADGDTAAESPHDEADDHFVPPTPPPIPRGDAISRAAWTGVLGAPALFVLIALLQWTPPGWLTTGLIASFVAGFVTLIARLRGHHPDDPDNGAVV